MLEGMTAHDLAQVQNFPIQYLEDLRCPIKPRSPKKIPSPSVFCLEEHGQEWNKKNWIRLQEKVNSHIAGSLNLTPVPVNHASHTEHHQY